MPRHRSGAGDPAHTLHLLWRTPGRPARGPRQTRSVDDVVRAGITLADESGLDAVTVRALATRLGVSPMSVYTYVPGRAELLDLMLDTLYARMDRPALAGLAWRERVVRIAEANRDLYRRHPWAATVSTARPPLGPGLMAKYEYELGALDGLGLSDVDMDAALTHLLGFVRYCAQAAADVAGAARDSAMSDQQWWQANEPLLARVFDAERYPLATRVGSAAGAAAGAAYHPDRAYDFGLARILDGLAALVGAP